MIVKNLTISNSKFSIEQDFIGYSTFLYVPITSTNDSRGTEFKYFIISILREKT